MSSGPNWERGNDEITGDSTWEKEYSRGDYVERDVYPDRGDHYVEEEYRDGSTYRVYDDGSYEKTSGK